MIVLPSPRHTAVAVRVLIYLFLTLAPLTVVMRYRALPFDDCMRHAAKVVSGKDWSEILVQREDVTMDQHPGWHAALGVIHRTLHGDQAFLVICQWLGMFLLVTLCPLPQFVRPEAWCASLLLAVVTSPYTMVFRLSRGRPYLFTMAMTMFLLLLWHPCNASQKKSVLLVTITLIALSVWVHGSWYLFALLALAVLLGRGWIAGFRFAACWLMGSLLGAAFTGHPVTYLYEQIHHMLLAFGNGTGAQVLVGEFSPIGNAGPWLMLAALVVVTHRLITGQWAKDLLTGPMAILAGIGWILGITVARFWLDWGTPALLLLLAWLIQEMLIYTRIDAFKPRILLTLALGMAYFMAVTADLDGRWSRVEVEPMPSLSGDNTEYSVPLWMPEADGIVYSAEMDVFNRLFYEYPHASCRYVYGYESGIMTPENLRILRHIQQKDFRPDTFQPWVQKMKPEDRLILFSDTCPPIKGLNWTRVTTMLWSGQAAKQ